MEPWSAPGRLDDGWTALLSRLWLLLDEGVIICHGKAMANSAIAEITRETLEKHEKSCKFPETASDLGPNVNHFHVLSYGFA